MFWKISRFSKFHNTLRVVYNNAAFVLPNNIKYGLGKLLRSRRLPYRLLQNGWTVVQIGCPWDLIKAGRSRGIYFSLFAGAKGKVVIIEPDAMNIKELHSFLKKEKIQNVTVIEKGAWSKKDRLRFLSDPNHPAANIVESVYDSERKDRANFNVKEIEVDSVDNILASLNIQHIDLISITTNGSEQEILHGMSGILGRTKYISSIGDTEVVKILTSYGFSAFKEDDRGRTYIHSAAF